MSGIINSVGAKSGIIGSTEIPGGYEEGTWTPTCTVALHGSSSPTGVYTRVGDIVFCSGYLRLGTENATDFGGLPFTSRVSPFPGRTGGGPVTYNAEVVSMFVVTHGASQEFRFTTYSDERTLTDDNLEVQFCLTYKV